MKFIYNQYSDVTFHIYIFKTYDFIQININLDTLAIIYLNRLAIKLIVLQKNKFHNLKNIWTGEHFGH